ncbi:MAG TPA: PAS domain S-box protein, partial [Marinagarivorans sp.]
MLGLDLLIAVFCGAFIGLVASCIARRRARRHGDLIAFIVKIQSQFLNDGDAKAAFYQLLDELARLTGSNYGYIAEVKSDEHGERYLKTRALLDSAWPPETRARYRELDVGGGMEFHDLSNILSSVLTTESSVFINDMDAYRQAASQHNVRTITTFIGLPVVVDKRLVGVVGLANRAKGYEVEQENELAPLLATIGQIFDSCIMTAQKEEAESKFEVAQGLVDSSNDAIVLLENGVFTDCNPATEALFQCSKADFVGKAPHVLSPEHQADGSLSRLQIKQYVERALSGEPQRFLWQYERPSGEVFTADVSLSRVDSGDERKLFAGVMRDVTQQERFQAEIRRQKSYLELIISGTAAGVWDWNLKTGAVTFNERWAAIVGYSLAELSPVSIKTWEEVCHPDDLLTTGALLEAYWRGDTDVYTCEARLRHKDGSWVWVLNAGKTVEWDDDGSPLRMVGTHLDITQLKRSQEQVDYANLQLKNFFDLSQDYMCVANVSGHFEKVNQTFTRQLGYSESELLLQPFFNFIHPDDYERTMDELLSLSDGHSSSNFRNRFRKREGSYVILQWNFTPDPNSGRVYATANDVTEKEKAEQELRTLSRIAKEVRNGVVIADIDGRIKWMNAAFERISGYQCDQVVGQKPGDFLQGEATDPNVVRAMREALREQRAFHVEVANYHKDGSVYWVDVDCSPMFDGAGGVDGFMAIQTDVTQQKLSALELERQQTLLEQMSEVGRIGAWEIDLIHREVYWSAMTRRILQVGSDFETTLDSAISFCKEGDSRNAMLEATQNAMQHGTPWHLELMLITAKGDEIWGLSSGKAVFANGRCVKLYGSFQDIDERKRHAMTHQQSVAHSQALADLTLHPEILDGNPNKAIPIIVARCAKALQVSRVSVWLSSDDNSELTCLSLYNADDESHSSGVVLRQKDYPDYFAFLHSHSVLSASDAHHHPGCYEFSENYFQPFNIVSTLDAVVLGCGKFIGVVCIESVGITRDWTAAEQAFASTVATIVSSVFDREQRRKTEQELIAAVQAANSAAQAKADFLTSMSHEIRTPMNGVLGMLGLMLKTDLTSEQLRKVNIALNSAQSLMTIINDILDFSKIDAGRVSLECVEFNVDNMLVEFSESMGF